MLSTGKIATRLPAQDLARARRFYSEKLGLEPVEEREGGLRYRCGSGEFALFKSAGSASGDHTQMGWEVDDIDASLGVVEANGGSTVRPKEPVGDVGWAAYFRDPEGNVLGMWQAAPGGG